MKTSRRATLRFALLPALFATAVSAAWPAAASMRDGKVFTSSNAADGNTVLVYEPTEGGALALIASVPTGGLGSGAGLGSQGAVTVSGDGRHLFVVNALSNTVSTLAVRDGALQVISVVASGGLHPISVTEHEGLVYVLNDQGEGNLAGFRNERGVLEPIPGSVRGLSAASGTTPAQAGFSPDGQVLVVTEKGTNRIVSYPVKPTGLLGTIVVTPSSGLTPFGFAFNAQGRLVVSEAFGGAAGASAASSYRFEPGLPARPLIRSASVPTTQTSACWVATTPNGRWAYVSNTGSGTVSRYEIAPAGRITLADAEAGSTGEGSAPADSAVSADGRKLYVRNGNATISAFAIEAGGALAPLPGAADLPPGSVGLAAN